MRYYIMPNRMTLMKKINAYITVKVRRKWILHAVRVDTLGKNPKACTDTEPCTKMFLAVIITPRNTDSPNGHQLKKGYVKCIAMQWRCHQP